MTHRLRPDELNGDSDVSDYEDMRSLLLEIREDVREFKADFGQSPDPATGDPGSGMCKVVAELKAESDYQARLRYEKAQKLERRSKVVQYAYYVLAGLLALGGVAWTAFRFLVRVSH